MTEQTKALSTHYTFTIDRTYAATPDRVFRAFSDPSQKMQWFTGSENWKATQREFDFAVDGREILNGTWGDGTTSAFTCRYNDIVENERIVYTYSMHINGELISFSLATLELRPSGAQTALRYTEQITCVDGHDDVNGDNRKQGTISLFERIEAMLA